jgi:hypothetical protein
MSRHRMVKVEVSKPFRNVGGAIGRALERSGIVVKALKRQSVK